MKALLKSICEFQKVIEHMLLIQIGWQNRWLIDILFIDTTCIKGRGVPTVSYKMFCSYYYLNLVKQLE